jgi:hypothetical protein
MKVKDLPKVIKKRAMVYIKKEFPIKKHRPKNIMNAFDWNKTKEGSDYWILVYKGKFSDAENHLRNKNGDDLKGELFEVEKKPFFLDEVLVNEPEVVSYKDEYVKIDPIVNIVLDKFLHRSRVGIEKYGTTLDRNDLHITEWIEHAIEEQMDNILYLTKLKNELSKKAEE